ncbi:MAG: hypothetical protein ACRD0K_09170 [Egibacteraceae bacterium]
MATHPNPLNAAVSLLVIEDPREERLLSLTDWLAALEHEEPIELDEPAAETLEQARAAGET